MTNNTMITDKKLKDLTKQELTVLVFIARNPNTAAKKISHLLEIQNSHIYIYINKLVKLKLVTKLEGRPNTYISEVFLNEL